MENKIELSEDLVNRIHQYLNTRPHGEVRALIDGLYQAVQQKDSNKDINVDDKQKLEIVDSNKDKK